MNHLCNKCQVSYCPTKRKIRLLSAKERRQWKMERCIYFKEKEDSS